MTRFFVSEKTLDRVICEIENTSDIEQKVHVDFDGYDFKGDFNSGTVMVIPAHESQKLMSSSISKEYRECSIYLTMLWVAKPNNATLTLDISSSNLGDRFTVNEKSIEKVQKNEHVNNFN